ncbi:hypothetical protein HWI79_1744 [Cryptosporidium felis]|nr:hypothetical protein HWI79_1744 [Cryptosporidium felis]
MLDRGLLQSIFGSDSASTPSGFQLNEVTNFSYSQENACRHLEDYLVKKLKKNDPTTKFKALRLIKHLCEKGNPTFKILIQRHAGQIKSCQSYRGAFDPVYGDTLSELVREEASQCLREMFSNGNRNDGNIRVGFQNREVGPAKESDWKRSCGGSGAADYKNRIHGFGNPHFVDRIDNESFSTDISQIGSSIVYNARTGQYNQVVEDLSDLVLKVLPNKLINGISDYYNSISSVNGRGDRNRSNFRGGGIGGHGSRPPPYNDNNARFRDEDFQNEIRMNPGTFQNTFLAANRKQIPESRIEIKNAYFGAEKTEPQTSPSTNALESRFIESYCSVTGLISTPSGELLQSSVRELQKLDVHLVIKMLHEKLVELCRPDVDEKDFSGGDSAGNSNKNLKVVFKILCLFLSMLETNDCTKKHLVSYADESFFQTLDQVSTKNVGCRRKVKQIQDVLCAGTPKPLTPHNLQKVDITDDLIDFRDQGPEEKKSPNELKTQESFENLDEKNNLFKNLFVKSYPKKSSASKRGEADGGGSSLVNENIEKSLIEL